MAKSMNSLSETTKKAALPTTRYMGSKRALLPFIQKHVEKLPCTRVLDAFSGTSCVSYMLKSMGKEVHSNDFLRFCYHVSNAVIANNTTQLSNTDLEALLKDNPKKETFVQDTFGERYFGEQDNLFLDNLWANLVLLKDSFKKSIALAAIARACMKKRPRGIFTFTGNKSWDGRRDLRLSLEDHFIAAVHEWNAALFNNGQKNKALNLDVFKVDPKSYDLVYMDTPYVSPYSDCDYVRRYHFVEGYCRHWKGVEIRQDTLTKKFKSYPTAFATPRTAEESFLKLFEHFQKSTLVVSYSSNAIPFKKDMMRLLRNFKKNVVCHEVAHKYSFGNHSHKVGDNNNSVKEFIFIAQ